MSVLILGASSPIARAMAARYAQAGHAVFLAARDVEEAERIAADVRLRHAVPAFAAAMDATGFSGHAGLIAEAEAALEGIDVAVLAFGDMGEQEVAEGDFNAAKRILDTNFTGAVSLCERLAETMVGRGRGSIVGISSVAGERGRSSNYFYGSAKGAFTLYLQGLRNRLHHHGVHVMTVKLGFVDTRMTYGMRTAIPVASPEAVARALFCAQQRRVDSLYYPLFWGAIMQAIKAIPEGLFKRLHL